MRIIEKAELNQLNEEKFTAKVAFKPELQAFLDCGAQWAELDCMGYSDTYASQVYMSLVRTCPEFRGKIAVHFKKHKVLAERI